MTHQDIDRRSLMMHRIIAARLRAQPELIAVAHANMARWNCPEPGWWQEWSAVLSSQTVEEIASLIERDDEDACRMRQSAPFAGILTANEVWELKRTFKTSLNSPASSDRVAVTHSSRGLQPTGSGAGSLCRVATLQSRSQPGSGDDFAVSLRDTEALDNCFRGLKPTATVLHHYVVEQVRQRWVDILSTGRTECPPPFGGKPPATLLPSPHLPLGSQRTCPSPQASNLHARFSPLTAAF